MFKQLIASLLVVTAANAGDSKEPFRYIIRTVKNDTVSSLRTAVKMFTPSSGTGPTIILVAASHIGESDYYAAIQTRLNACDLVLYEGVGVPEFKKVASPDCKDPLAWTRSALAYMRDMAVWYRTEMKSLPTDLRRLRLATKLHNRKELAWVERAKANAWGKPITIELKNGVCTLTSLGRDGKPGGEGLDKDLTATVSETTRRSDDGSLQRRLANALGLEFQLDTIDYSKPTFVNSDMTVTMIRARTSGKKPPTTTVVPKQSDSIPDPATTRAAPKASDDEFNKLLALLQGGNPAIDGIAALAEGILSKSEKGREMVKWIFCESMAAAEVMMEDLMGSKSDAFESEANMMRVLIRERNGIIVRDLKQHLKGRPQVTTIAIFYGAGHMRDLEARLIKDLAYKTSGVEWLEAFDADRDKAGITAEQAQSIRKSIAEQMKVLK